MSILTTQRLRLEPLNDDHLDGLFRLNSDPEVMRYITGKPETREETIAMIERIKVRWIEFGFSWWSFIELKTNELIGAGCIQYLGRDPANPLEIGWRLRQDKWGQGFASEAAQRMAEFAFDQIGGDSLFAICDQDNVGSANVMKKLGMQYRGIERWNDMDTATYAISRADWKVREARKTNKAD
ncbi:GNAT family N-acetyltransferase [Undibacterium sp. RTI2.2]|nr:MULTISPECIES: GNAT family N-acetyltransferase [unclassified Undibacterium]MDY7536700.1 GNAT family N-acetyltransferase [Undibacterium sp. 5I1]MEB0118542.1 GNAT family N-acetyltransferase [Undibacterium sp. RTI2.2]MEB0230255.1 GNAT family N-acetyltransferase [Undibacterium sp. 10I3]MEB0257955.1 GNAT family N-acetyltransferase [Undibacterium sp. 5I1]